MGDSKTNIAADKKKRQQCLNDTPDGLPSDLGNIINAVTDNTDVRLAYLDRDFNYVWVNLSYARGIGYDTQGLIGKNHFDLFTNQEHLALLQKLIETGEKGVLRDTSFPLPFQPKQVLSYWDVVAIPMKDIADKISGLVLTLSETTERRNIEINLERIAREWRTAFDNIPDLISLHDINYKVARANRSLSNALKMKPQDIIGKPCYELLHKSHEPPTSCPHRRAMESRAVVREELYEPTLDLHLDIVAAPMFDEDGQLLGSVHIARDITKRKIAEKALIESEKRYRDLIENMREGVWLIDKDAHTTFVNPRMADMLGYSPAEMRGKNLLDFMDERGIELAKYYLERRQQGIKERHEFEFIKKDGTLVYTMLDASPLRDAQGNYMGSSAVIEDITERKRHEIELNRLYQHEKELHNKLENELKKRMEFTHALVHELKTPLTPIVSSSDMLVRMLKEDRALRLAKNVYSGATDMEHRVDALLELARLEVGMQTLKLGLVDILRLIRDTASYMMPQAMNKEQLIHVHLPRSLPKITADMERLRQVLINLIGNGLTHTAPGSEIVVSAWREDDNIMIEVQDNGQGIAEEMQSHLFDPYFQIQNSVDRLGGLGLGLPIAKNIVEQHGGHMWVKSESGRGSTFGFSLPINRQDSGKLGQSG